MPLFLIGFMAAGKTSAGKALAAATGRSFIDLDDIIAAEARRPVADLVREDLADFRQREANALERVCRHEKHAVIATGGGAATFGDNLDRMRAHGLVIALGVDVPEAQRRGTGGDRPLLANAPQLAAQRAPVYRRAHAVVETTGRTLAEVVAQLKHVERVWTALPRGQFAATLVALGERTYAVTTAPGMRRDLLEAAIDSPSKIAIVTDANVARHHLAPLVDDLRYMGHEPVVVEIEPGEASKSFATYERVTSELVVRGLDRSSVVLALGGGVVGDLSGFVAATLYRGIPIVQLPTTLVAMTDAAIGGKTAIDLAAGKNLVGAFWQPRLVHCATSTLSTLPARERRAGFGELWKYALLDGRELWDAVAACAPWAAGPEGAAPPAELQTVIDRCIAYKAAIVGRDERELTGHRALLNLGHTVGHAIETASGMLHGEAVGLGLVAACHVSAHLLGAPNLADEVAAALAASGLPSDPTPWFTDEVLARIKVDKKRIGANLRFVAIREVGACEPVEIAVTELTKILRPLRRP